MTETLVPRALDLERAPRLDLDEASARPVSFAERGATLRAFVVDPEAKAGVAVRALDAVAAAACCGPGECGPDACAVAGDPPPVLLLGSPGWTGGWVTEVEGTYDDTVVDALVARAVEYAMSIGARVVAAGCTSRGGGDRIEAALVTLGATAWQHAHEDFVTLEGPAETYLDALPPAVLRRRARDLTATAEAGIVIRPLDATEVAKNLARLDELTEAASDGEPFRTGDGALWWGAFEGDVLRGYCTALPAGDTLWLGSRGFSSDRNGFNTGAYFALTHHVVVDAAAELGFRRVEFGGGSHYARIVRGCASRAVRSATLDPEVS
jgi:hypothetical protein